MFWLDVSQAHPTLTKFFTQLCFILSKPLSLILFPAYNPTHFLVLSNLLVFCGINHFNQINFDELLNKMRKMGTSVKIQAALRLPKIKIPQF